MHRVCTRPATPPTGTTSPPTTNSCSATWRASATAGPASATVISLILDGEEHLFEGIVEGHIAQCASGSEGFGYDPLFIPEGSAKTYAEMDPAEKNALSHRGRAVRKLAEFLHNRGK